MLTQISICSQITCILNIFPLSPFFFFFLQLGRKWALSSCQISPVYSMNTVQELLPSFAADYLRKFKWLPWIALQLYSPRMRVIVQTNTWFFFGKENPTFCWYFPMELNEEKKTGLGQMVGTGWMLLILLQSIYQTHCQKQCSLKKIVSVLFFKP